MRKCYLDYLRVGAIFAVICTHVTEIFYTRYGTIGLFDWWLANLLNAASRFAAPLFVMISGALLLGKPQNTIDFYKKRWLRLFPAMIFWTLFYLGFEYYRTLDLGKLLWYLKIGLLLEGHSAGHLWFLSMFACLMVFAPFINKCLIGEKPSQADIAILLGILLGFCMLEQISTLTDFILGRPFYWFVNFPWYIAYFIGGYYLDRYADQIRLANTLMALLAITLILLGAVLNDYVARHGVVKSHYILDNKSPLVFIISFLVFLMVKKQAPNLPENRIILSISEASFGIYLLHPVLIHGLNTLLPPYGMPGALYLSVIISLTALASYVGVHWLRKIKVIRAVL